MQTEKVIASSDVPALEFGPTAPGASIRWLIGAQDGAPVYALRMIEIAPGGNSPRHSHPYEHENFIVAGQGKVLIGTEWFELKPEDVAFVPAGVEHQYVNTGESTLRFLCGIPVEHQPPAIMPRC